MALKAGAKSRVLRPLPPALPPVRWLEQVTGEALYPWQAVEVEALCRPVRPRVAYVQVPRKNGKTRLAALVALHEACLGGEGRHVYAVSDTERSLNTTFRRELVDIIGRSPWLRDSIHIFKAHFEVPQTGSFIQMCPNKFGATQGINPHVVLFDEVHTQKDWDTWEGMQMAGAARPDALLLGITTPGYDLASPAHALYERARAGTGGLYSRIFEVDPAADVDDREAWRAANPCYDREGFLAGLEYDREHAQEHNFRRFRLGAWTATERAWLPHGAWKALEAPRRPPPEPGSRVWLGFDGSYANDSTALVGVTEDLHVFVAGCWENPGRPGWRVPRPEVHDAVADAMNTWNVIQMFCDPPYWLAEIAEWAALYGSRVAEFPTSSRARMAPACTAFYSAVMEGSLTHDGDPRLARHISNAIVKASPVGDFITKPDKNSPSKIDLAVAAVIAFHAAATCKTPPQSPLVVL